MLRWFAPQPCCWGWVVLGGILRRTATPRRRGVLRWAPWSSSPASSGFHQLAAASDTTGVPGDIWPCSLGGTTLAAWWSPPFPRSCSGARGSLRPAFRAPVGWPTDLVAWPRPWCSPRSALVFATVAVGRGDFRSGVGVLPGPGIPPGASSWSRMRRCCFPCCPTPCPGSPGPWPGDPGEPAVPAGPEAHSSLRPRSTRRRRRCSPARRGTVRHRRSARWPGGHVRRPPLGAVAASAVAAAAIPVGGFFTALDAARETTHGRAALDALAPGLWAGAPSLLLLGLVGCCAPPSTCAAGRSSREEPSRPRG